MKLSFFTKKISFSAFLIVIFFIATTFYSCEGNDIAAEKSRLEQIENEILKAISEKNYEYGKVLCIKMQWQYVGKTAGAQGECKELKKTWEKKRREYLKIMGFNPDEILEKEDKKTALQEFLGT